MSDPFAPTTDQFAGLFDKKENVVSDRTVEIADMSVTLKGDGAAPWIVSHKDQMHQVDAIRQAVDSGLLKVVAEAAAAFAAEWSAARGQTTPVAERPRFNTSQSTPPVQRPAPSDGGAKTCNHGDMTYRSGEKNGKEWGGWFCPTEKGDPSQCKPVWKKF